MSVTMDGKNALNLLKDRRILVIIIAVIIIVAAVAYVVLSGDDDGGSDNPSDGLTITGEQTFSDDRVIEGTLTIEADGKLTLTDGAEIRMLGADARIEVLGTLDASQGRISFVTQNEDGTYSVVNSNGTGESRSITVSGNGEIIVDGNNFESTGHFDDSTGIREFVNGATYDDEPNVHITTLARALAAEGDVTIRGTLSDSTAVTAGEDRIIIDTGARATLGTITLTNGGSVEALGTVSAKVAFSGSTLDLSGVSGLKVSSSGNFAIDGKMTGSMTVSAGTVYVGNVDATAGTVAVAQGATMVFQKTNTLGGVMLIGGNDNSFVINGIVVVGAQPESLTATVDENIGFGGSSAENPGKFTVAGTGYVKVYRTADWTTDDIKNTVFDIDGTPYMTVYGNATIASVLAAENVNSKIVSDATAFKNVANWNDTENMSGDAVTESTTLGVDGFTTIYYATVKVTLTVTIPNTTGLSLTIDGERVSSGTIVLAAGEHTFSISKDQNDNNSYVLMLGNNECTGNKFTIVSGVTTLSVVAEDTTTTPPEQSGGAGTGVGGNTGVDDEDSETKTPETPVS